jgi:gluconate 5-dehydrogenase
MSDAVETAPLPPATLFDLAGRVALVTGSSRGLGWAIARTLAAAGARVVLNGRDTATLAPRRAALEAWGLAAELAPFDVTEAAAATAAVADIAARHGRLDILVSNAGSSVRKPVLEQTDDDLRAVLEAHLVSGFRLAREAARLMVPAGYGRIVFISSINAFIARPGIPGYVTAKSGMNGMVRALGVEFAQTGVTVNAIAPGYFLTAGNEAVRRANPDFQARISARTPAGRWGVPDEEIGAAALYLVSDAARYTTGSVITVDGALTAAL